MKAGRGYDVKHVESLFFGSSDQLFGMFHPAIGNQRNHGVVVCAPLFHEYYRSHFVLKGIATELAQKGYDVLRFDYTGTGDSKGAIPPDMFNMWSDDIGEALTEIRQLGGGASTSLLGLRFGASLGLPWQRKVVRYVCWDSVPNHEDYAGQLDETHSVSLEEHATMSSDELSQHAEDDYLGTGLSRSSVKQSFANFISRSDAQWPATTSPDAIDIRSDTDWVRPGLERIYALETQRQIADAM